MWHDARPAFTVGATYTKMGPRFLLIPVRNKRKAPEPSLTAGLTSVYSYEKPGSECPFDLQIVTEVVHSQ
jgi:hypothetical protein